MDYEKEYKKRLDDARYWHDVSEGDIPAVLEEIFSELREGEDERIRKEILEYFQQFENEELRGVNISDWIAWLEKQNETKEINEASYRTGIKRVLDNPESYGLKKQGEQKPVVIIPKFRVGDEVETGNEESLTITRIDEDGYWSNDLFICGFDDSDEWELVEQKPGDKVEPNLTEFEDAIKGMMDVYREAIGVNDATTEEVKEHVAYLLSLIPHKSAEWSEEDEKMLEGIVNTVKDARCQSLLSEIGIYDEYIDWLKSLKPQPKQQWGEEDERERKRIIGLLEGWLSTFKETCYAEDCKCGIDWLKSLRPQKHWKPSNENMYYLNWIANIELGDSVVEREVSKHLNELYNDLKKL